MTNIECRSVSFSFDIRHSKFIIRYYPHQPSSSAIALATADHLFFASKKYLCARNDRYK
jgi:hypothetical protein